MGQVVGGAEVGEVGEGVPDRAELPVEDRQDARGVRRVEDQVVNPEVAVDEGRAVGGGVGGGGGAGLEPLPEREDLGERGVPAGRRRGRDLPGPPPELARGVPVRPPQRRQAGGGGVDVVEAREGLDRPAAHAGALGGGQGLQGHVLVDDPRHVGHDVKVRPEDGGVGAEVEGAGHGHPGGAQGRDDAVLARHVVGRLEELPGGLLSEHCGGSGGAPGRGVRGTGGPRAGRGEGAAGARPPHPGAHRGRGTGRPVPRRW